MSSPAAVVDLIFNATDIQDPDFRIFLEMVRGLGEPPSVRGTDTIVPGRAGRIARSRVGDVLAIELRGIVAGVGDDRAERLADFANSREVIRALFDPTAMPADLVAVLEDGAVATIAARTLNIVWDQINESAARISIEMESVAPAWDIVPAGS